MHPTFSPGDAVALAAGWPHRLTLGKPSKRDPLTRAVALLSRVDPKTVRWDRPMAEAYVRGWGISTGKPSRTALAAMEGPPLDATAFSELLPRWVRRDRYRFQWTALVLAAEALIGPDAVVESIATLFEGFTTKRWTKDRPAMLFKRALTSPAYLGYAVGFPLLRAADPIAAHERLRAAASRGPEGSTGRVALELVLDGAQAARRHDLDLLAALHFAQDDPGYVRSCSATARLDASLSPRFVWIGGTEVLDHFAHRFRERLPDAYAVTAVEQFGVFAVPEVLPVMVALATRSRARKRAWRWFDDHSDFAAAHEAVWNDLDGAAIVRARP